MASVADGMPPAPEGTDTNTPRAFCVPGGSTVISDGPAPALPTPPASRVKRPRRGGGGQAERGGPLSPVPGLSPDPWVLECQPGQRRQPRSNFRGCNKSLPLSSYFGSEIWGRTVCSRCF